MVIRPLATHTGRACSALPLAEGTLQPAVQRRFTDRVARLVTGVGLALLITPVSAAEPPPLAKTVCLACHGEAGISPAPVFPSLAGLQADYIEKQLKDFLSGKRKNEVMQPSLEQLKEADIPALAAFYAGLKPPKGIAAEAKLAAPGKQLYEDGNTTSGVPACMGCHQPAGVGNERYPRLAGQHADYTKAQMQAFKSGARNNDKAKVMRAVAERMTEAEMEAVSAYMAGL